MFVKKKHVLVKVFIDLLQHNQLNQQVLLAINQFG